MKMLGNAVWFILTVILGALMYIGLVNSNLDMIYFSAILLAAVTGLFIGIDIGCDVKKK